MPFVSAHKIALLLLTNLELCQHARAFWWRPRDHLWLLFYFLKTGYSPLLYPWWFFWDLRVITKHLLKEPKMKEELYPSPGEKWKNHPDPTSILCFSQGNDTIFQTTLEGSSRLSTKWTISPSFIILPPHSSKFHLHILLSVPISRSSPMLLCSSSTLFPTSPVSNSPPPGSFPHHLIPLWSNCSFILLSTYSLVHIR